jgi:hypothetical protein
MTQSNVGSILVKAVKKKLLLILSPNYNTTAIKTAIGAYSDAIASEGWELIEHDLTADELTWQRVRDIVISNYNTERQLANLIVGEDINYLPQNSNFYWDYGYTGYDAPATSPFYNLSTPELTDNCWLRSSFFINVDIPTAVIIPSIYNTLSTRRTQVGNAFYKFANRDLTGYGNTVRSMLKDDSDYVRTCYLNRVMPLLGTNNHTRDPTSADLDDLAITKYKLVYLFSHAWYAGMVLGYSASAFHNIKSPIAALTGCMVAGWLPSETTTKCVVEPPYKPSNYFGYAILASADLRLAILGYVSWFLYCAYNDPTCPKVPHTESCIIDDSSPRVKAIGVFDRVVEKMANGQSFAEALKGENVEPEFTIYGDPTFKF